MRLFKNSFTYCIFYAMGAILMSALGLLPRRARLSFSRALGNIWWLLDMPNRRLMERDIKIALKHELCRSRREQAVRRSMENLIAHVVDAYFSPRFKDGKILSLVLNAQWLDKVESALRRGRGAIILTAHFGNAELLHYLLATKVKSNCVARYQRVFNPLLVRHRLKMNVSTLIGTENSYFKMLHCLKRNELILAAFDRPSRRVPGVRTTMFGKTVITPYYPIDVARVARTTIFIVFLVRERGKYRIYGDGPISVPSKGDLRYTRERCAQMAVSALEKCVRMFPEQWNWGQKKFSKPRGKDAYGEAREESQAHKTA